MKKTILIIEDEEVLREVIKDYLLTEGYKVLEATDGLEGLDLFYEHEIDLVILDVMLPKLDGWSVCRRIRKASHIPIIMFTARSDEEDALLGFELGVDDYITKPFSPRILLAKVNRFLEKQCRQEESMGMLSSSGIEVQLSSRKASVEGKEINLTYTEFEILAYLMKNVGIAIKRDQLIMKVWGYDFIGDERTINSHIRNLRSKLGNKANCINTIIRVGYKFEEQI